MPILVVLQALFGVLCVAGFLFLRQRYENKASADRTRENVILLITGTTMIASVWLLDVVSRNLLESGEAFETRLIASLQQLAMLFCLELENPLARNCFRLQPCRGDICISNFRQSPSCLAAAFFLVASGWWMFEEHWQRLKPALAARRPNLFGLKWVRSCFCRHCPSLASPGPRPWSALAALCQVRAVRIPLIPTLLWGR